MECIENWGSGINPRGPRVEKSSGVYGGGVPQPLEHRSAHSCRLGMPYASQDGETIGRREAQLVEECGTALELAQKEGGRAIGVAISARSGAPCLLLADGADPRRA